MYIQTHNGILRFTDTYLLRTRENCYGPGYLILYWSIGATDAIHNIIQVSMLRTFYGCPSDNLSALFGCPKEGVREKGLIVNIIVYRLL